MRGRGGSLEERYAPEYRILKFDLDIFQILQFLDGGHLDTETVENLTLFIKSTCKIKGFKWISCRLHY